MTRHLDPDRSPPPRFWPFPIDIDTSVCDRCSAMVPATDKAQTQHTDHHRQVDALAAGFAIVALTAQLSDPGSRGDASATADADASPGSGPTSGSGSSRPSSGRQVPDASPDPASTSEGAGSPLPSRAAASTAGPPSSRAPSDAKSPPTPPEEATAGPGGAEGSNDGTEADAAAGTSLGDVTEAPAPSPPGAGATKRNPWMTPTPGGPPDPGVHPGGPPGTPPSRATKRVGRGSGDVGDSTVSAPADTNRSRPAADLGREPTGRLHLVDPEPPDYGRFTR